MYAIPAGANPGKSNAALSGEAQQASVDAKRASADTHQGDFESHDRAAQAHRDASYKHRDAGNGTKADQHAAQATIHQEKADSGRQLKQFADDQSKKAEELTAKSAKAQFGQDEKDPRGEQELHADAAQAHDRAAKAHQMAGCDREASYHQAASIKHEQLSKMPAPADKTVAPPG